MDYHERGSLFDYLVENTLTPELCIKMAHSIASGVEHLHKGLIPKLWLIIYAFWHVDKVALTLMTVSIKGHSYLLAFWSTRNDKNIKMNQ